MLKIFRKAIGSSSTDRSSSASGSTNGIQTSPNAHGIPNYNTYNKKELKGIWTNPNQDMNTFFIYSTH